MKKHKILAVDDELFNLDILVIYLEEAGFEVITAEDGDIALSILHNTPDIDIVVLDRMMPRMNGIEMLKHMRNDPKLCEIPVIMQTAAANSQQIIEGIQAGVYYYLTKPYEDVMLISLVKAAIADVTNMREMKQEVVSHRNAMCLMEKSQYRFRTLEEAKNIAFTVASCFPEPDKVVYGLYELMVNAIEHGNLGITYKDKTRLLMEGEWENEVKKRLELPENRGKYATLTYETVNGETRISIKDKGTGFDWSEYMNITPDRVTHPHGRGIAIARMESFDEIEYFGDGSEVQCRMKAKAA